ncbi:hypothetical protein [Amycolatopsis tolypomycina]|uniref:Uncharacterized protein n=1 Tax=Amycolatopsis tolypomycina TaxID=208445 RepID=A0A1H4J7J1_9PSEU|nr:hypothetical protein [Amycolatopsis tolypomycina]SEB42264.1 hypothetical protein SAMN04489727_1611 [Amycolatopsis tolypomycina]
MNISEDELEQRLRALFADERLDLPPPPDAETAIVVGARRRRRRRHVAQAVTGVAAAVVAVAGGLTMVRLHTEDSTAAMSPGSLGTSGKPPENLTPGWSPEPTTPGPTATRSIQDSARPDEPTSAPPRTPPSQKATVLPGAASGPLLAADGFGKLKLGMSEADVAAQAVTLSDPQAGASCTAYRAQGDGVPVSASVVISKTAGVVVVTPDVAAHTAEGIGAGSTKDQILAAYPAAKEEAGGVVAPVGAAAEYRFRLGDNGVVQTSLTSATQDCAG